MPFSHTVKNKNSKYFCIDKRMENYLIKFYSLTTKIYFMSVNTNQTTMRKLKLQMQMTINGYVAGLKGENDWMTWNPDAEFIEFLSSLLDTSDTLLLGRKTADGIIKYWENEADKNPTHPFAKKIAAIPKVVFTKTLDKSPWNNTTLA